MKPCSRTTAVIGYTNMYVVGKQKFNELCVQCRRAAAGRVYYSAFGRDHYCYACFPPPPHGAALRLAAGSWKTALWGAVRRSGARFVT